MGVAPGVVVRSKGALELVTLGLRAIVTAKSLITSLSSRCGVSDQVIRDLDTAWPIHLVIFMVITKRSYYRLGLPKDSSSALVIVFQSSREELQQSLQSSTLRLPHLVQTDWRVDAIIASSASSEAMHGAVHMKLVMDKSLKAGGAKTAAFEISPDKFRVLFGELSDAAKLMATS